jgi:membrane protein YdbS with pleckstrin-like domain
MGPVTDPFAATGVPQPGALTWLQPSPRLLALRRAQVRLSTAALLVGAGIAAVFFLLPGLLSVAAVAVGGVLAELVAVRRFRRWGYAERAEDLMVRRGVMVRRLSVVPYGRMQFVDVVAGPLERRWGLATVRLHTAAAASDARVPGLPASEAERLRDRLAMLGESRAAGL